MNDWKHWVIVLGGVLAAVGQFWGMQYYLSLIGGILAAGFALIPE